MERNFLPRGSGRIAYETAGQGPLVVCIPGMGDLRSTFRHVVPALVAAGHRVAVFDLRGHGDSDCTFDSYDDIAAAQDALALIDHLGGGPAVVIGNSMGAGAAAWAAAERPDAVAGLVLVGAFVRNPPAGAVTAALTRLMMRALLWRPWGRAAWSSYYASLFPSRPQSADHREHRAAVLRSLARPQHWRAFQKTARTSHAPVEARLPEVSAPALVVMGSKDRDWPDPVAEAHWIEGALGAKVHIVDGAGHYPQAEFPQATVPAILDHVREAFARA